MDRRRSARILLAVTAVAHPVLAALVRRHAAASGRNRDRWTVATLLTGAFGTAAYVLTAPTDDRD